MSTFDSTLSGTILALISSQVSFFNVTYSTFVGCVIKLNGHNNKKAATGSVPASFQFAACIRVGLSGFSHQRRVLVLPLVYLFFRSASHRSLQGKCMTNLFGKDGHWGCNRQQLADGKTSFVSDSLYCDSVHCIRVNRNRHDKRGVHTS